MSMKNTKLCIFLTKLYTIFYSKKLPKFTTLQPIFGSYMMILESKLLSIAILSKVQK